MPEVVVYILEGRSLEQKRGLVKDITDAVVKNAGTTADQVTVSLVETAKTSKAKGGRPVQRDAPDARSPSQKASILVKGPGSAAGPRPQACSRLFHGC